MKLEFPVSARQFVEEHATITPMRIIVAVVFGGLALAIFGTAVVRERGSRFSISRHRALLSVEEAARGNA